MSPEEMRRKWAEDDRRAQQRIEDERRERQRKKEREQDRQDAERRHRERLSATERSRPAARSYASEDDLNYDVAPRRGFFSRLWGLLWLLIKLWLVAAAVYGIYRLVTNNG